MILRSENFCSPERRSKVVKFAKNDRLDVLIVLARDEQFLLFPWKWSKGGTIWWIFSHFLTWWDPTILIFYLVLTSTVLIRIIYFYKIVLFVYTDTFWPQSCIMSAYSTNTQLVLVVFVAKLNWAAWSSNWSWAGASCALTNHFHNLLSMKHQLVGKLAK